MQRLVDLYLSVEAAEATSMGLVQVDGVGRWRSGADCDAVVVEWWCLGADAG